MTIRDRLGELREAVEERTGVAVTSRERLDLLESSDHERRMLQRELDLLAYEALDYVGNAPQEMKPVARRKLIQKARVAWMKDPQAGAAVDLMNDFVFGRGIPKPKANDPQVQKVIDEAWDDPDNQLVLTSFAAQIALGTDLSLQSNLFLLVFDDGEDGKVKLGLLQHDAVENVVRDPENRLRILFFVARHFKQKWDYKLDQPAQDYTVPEKNAEGKGEIRYYAHWRNVEDALEDSKNNLRPRPDMPPANKLGAGKVYHVAVNRTSEMAFGHPTMDRTLRWFTAYNAFMDARLDIIQAKAAFVMKRKVKGTPTQLQKIATQALSRRSRLGQHEGWEHEHGPRPGAILNENEEVTHEDISFDTGASSAMADGQMIRAQTSAATRFPQSYYGDASSANLATATSLELPVLKTVEARQEIVEAMTRFFIDRVIERAVDAGRISAELTDEELEDRGEKTTADDEQEPTQLAAAHEDAVEDEEITERDLGYEFSMPSPLRRMMADLITAVMNIARTFDPNNTNVELSRILLTTALGEGLELEDPAGAVDKIFPPGYVDPAIAAAAQQPPAQAQLDFGEFTPVQTPPPVGPDGQRHPDPANPYGAPLRAQPPEQVMQQAATPVPRQRVTLEEVAYDRLPAAARARVDARRAAVAGQFEDEVLAVLSSSNGNGNGSG